MRQPSPLGVINPGLGNGSGGINFEGQCLPGQLKYIANKTILHNSRNNRNIPRVLANQFRDRQIEALPEARRKGQIGQISRQMGQKMRVRLSGGTFGPGKENGLFAQCLAFEAVAPIELTV